MFKNVHQEGASMPNNEFYDGLRQKISGYTGQYSEYVLLVPDLFMLVSRLMLDKRVESKHKVYLGAALAYVVSPIDLFPERVFGKIAYIDDVAVLVAVLNIVLNEVDNQIILEHWSGKADLLQTVRRFLGEADQMIGKGRIAKLLDYLGIRRPGPASSA